MSRDASMANVTQIQNSAVDLIKPQDAPQTPIGSSHQNGINSITSKIKRESAPNSGTSKTTLAQEIPYKQGRRCFVIFYIFITIFVLHL